jgi:hypothetical protein
MKLHGNARLSPKGRLLLCRRVLGSPFTPIGSTCYRTSATGSPTRGRRRRRGPGDRSRRQTAADERPFRTHVGASRDGNKVVSVVADSIRAALFHRVGIGDPHCAASLTKPPAPAVSPGAHLHDRGSMMDCSTNLHRKRARRRPRPDSEVHG